MRPSGWLCQPANTDNPGQPLCPSDFSPCTHLLPPPNEAEIARIHRPPPAVAPASSGSSSGSGGSSNVVAVAWGDERSSSHGDPAAAMDALAAHRALTRPPPPSPRPSEAALHSSPPPPRPPWWLIGDDGRVDHASQRPEQSGPATTQPAAFAAVDASSSSAVVSQQPVPPLLQVRHAETGHARAAVSAVAAHVEPTSPPDVDASAAGGPAGVASLLGQPVYLGLLLSVAGVLGCALPARRRRGGDRVGGDHAEDGSATASLTSAAGNSRCREKPRGFGSSSRKVMRSVGARGGGGRQMAVALPRTDVELEGEASIMVDAESATGGAENIWL